VWSFSPPDEALTEHYRSSSPVSLSEQTMSGYHTDIDADDRGDIRMSDASGFDDSGIGNIETFSY
jgi:hypothetical protein